MMKKLQLKRKRAVANKKVPDARITNETVAEHRERILAGGKKFKYPHQYLRHRLVINAIIIGVVALLIAMTAVWWQLYRVQSSSDFIYRVTNALPVPVASVDGENVRYSDYLMRYRSQELWLRSQGQLGLNKEDGERQLDYIKRQVMDGLELDVYAIKRSKGLNVTVSDKEIDTLVDQLRDTSTGRISLESYNASVKATNGYSSSEYRHILGQSLVRQKIAYIIDGEAKKIAEKVAIELQKDDKKDFEGVVQRLSSQKISVEFGASGLVPKANKDGGLTQAALLLKNGEVSKPIQSKKVDDYGYYFIQKLSSNDKQVSYQFIKVPLITFMKEFKAVKDAGKIKEYIKLEAINQQTQ